MVDAHSWLMDIVANRETIDTDLLVAGLVAKRPDRVWSVSEVLRELRGQRRLEDLRDSVEELVGYWYLEEIVVVGCDTGCPADCADPLCGDALFRIRS